MPACCVCLPFARRARQGSDARAGAPARAGAGARAVLGCAREVARGATQPGSAKVLRAEELFDRPVQPACERESERDRREPFAMLERRDRLAARAHLVGELLLRVAVHEPCPPEIPVLRNPLRHADRFGDRPVARKRLSETGPFTARPRCRAEVTVPGTGFRAKCASRLGYGPAWTCPACRVRVAVARRCMLAAARPPPPCPRRRTARHRTARHRTARGPPPRPAAIRPRGERSARARTARPST